MIKVDIEKLNIQLRYKTPEEIADWALTLTNNRIVTTSFGVYSAVLLNTFSKRDKSIKILWCDTLYNTPSTYEHASNLIDKFQLNVKKYIPLESKEFIDEFLGIPKTDCPKHTEFTEVVKLEPFRRAINENQPKVWFTNIRIRQTEYRGSKDILSYSKEGILKISPFYYSSDDDLDRYLEVHNLPKNSSYFDPTKALQNRECGIHLL
jgi:phosphoadenosine phosphosulfate reductase